MQKHQHPKITPLLFIRSLLFWVCFVVPLPIYFLISLVTFPIGQRLRYKVMVTLCYFYCLVMRYVCGIKYVVKNPENIPKQPCVIVCNHQSMWETCTLIWIFTDIVFILKKEILKVPLFGWGINGIAPIAIDRSKGDLAMQKLIKQGKQRIGAGFSLMIFPEGTRLKVKQRKDFKHGAAKIAILLQTIITPVALDSGLLWPKKSFFLYPGTVNVVVGEPIIPPVNIDDCVDVTNKVQSWTYSELDKMGV
jgi:1-acyl-sn-glycerol-3-phosphate acyltransferase